MKKHAFLILAYKNLHLLKQLVQVLQHYNASIVIHFDAKSQLKYREYFKDEIELGQVHFIENNIKVNWGGFGFARAVFLMCDYALQNFKDCSYYHLLSEQCFPVKSPNAFISYFENNAGKNFIKTFPVPSPEHWGKSGGINRLQHYHLNDFFDARSASFSNLFLKSFNAVSLLLQSAIAFKRRFPSSFPALYGGSVWWSLTHDFLEYADLFYTSNETFRKRFQNTLLPEEVIMQTIFMQSPFADTYINNNLRYVDWRKELPGPCPRILSEQLHWDLIQQPDIMFARKINPGDNSFPEKIQQYLLKT